MGTNRATQNIVNRKDYYAGNIWGLGSHPLNAVGKMLGGWLREQQERDR